MSSEGCHVALVPQDARSLVGEDSSGEMVEAMVSRGFVCRHRRGKIVTCAVTSAVALALLAVAACTPSQLRSPFGSQGGVGLNAVKDCHDAKHGDKCYTDVVYAMKDRAKHPAWYFGMNNRSTFADFQAFMSTQVLDSGETRCPKPCAQPHRQHKKGKKPRGKKDCHTTVPGEQCYGHVVYTRSEAKKYPKWYPGIDEDSSFEDVQHYLQQENVCPEPCNRQKKKKLNKTNSSLLEDCHTARPGETCFSDILFAQDHIAKHPTWYKGLYNYSSRDKFQAYLADQKAVDKQAEKKQCPMPCNRDAVEYMRIRDLCQTAREGDDCYGSVVWGATVGINKHPNWYRRNNTVLTTESSFEDFQLFLHKGPKSRCPKRPCPCHTHVQGDACYGSVMWVMKHGVREHPHHFKGLTTKSTFLEVQAHLHATRTTPCLRPCVKKPW